MMSSISTSSLVYYFTVCFFYGCRSVRENFKNFVPIKNFPLYGICTIMFLDLNVEFHPNQVLARLLADGFVLITVLFGCG